MTQEKGVHMTIEEMRGRQMESKENQYRRALREKALKCKEEIEKNLQDMHTRVESEIARETGVPLDIIRKLGQSIQKEQ